MAAAVPRRDQQVGLAGAGVPDQKVLVAPGLAPRLLIHQRQQDAAQVRAATPQHVVHNRQPWRTGQYLALPNLALPNHEREESHACPHGMKPRSRCPRPARGRTWSTSRRVNRRRADVSPYRSLCMEYPDRDHATTPKALRRAGLDRLPLMSRFGTCTSDE
jgi:hypothetical protein